MLRVKRALRELKRQIANGYVKQSKLILTQTILAPKLVSQEGEGVFYVPIDLSGDALREQDPSSSTSAVSADTRQNGTSPKLSLFSFSSAYQMKPSSVATFSSSPNSQAFFAFYLRLYFRVVF